MRKIVAQTCLDIRAFKPYCLQAGHTWIEWDESHTPAFDVFYEAKPDLYIGPELNRPIRKCIEKYKTPYLEVFEDFTYYNSATQSTYSYDFLIDNVQWYREDKLDEFYCTLACCNVQPTSSIYDLINDYHVKILGTYAWPVPQYIGLCSLAQQRQLYSSAKAAYVQNKQEMCKAMGCQTPVFSDNVELLEWAQPLSDFPKIFENNEFGLLTIDKEKVYNTQAPQILEGLL